MVLELDNWPDYIPQLVGALHLNRKATGSIPAKELFSWLGLIKCM